jgi:hypothetical protein
MDHKAKLKDYDTRIQAALDEGTADGQEKADRLQLAKQQYEKSTPWGSATNHPGVLGKLGHIGENIASHLPIVGNVMRSIPGTTANRAIEHAGTVAQTAKDTELATAREAEEGKADKTALAPNLKQVSGGAVDPAHPELGQQVAYFNEKTGKTEFHGPVAEKPNAAQSKKDFQGTLAKIGTPEAADPKEQMTALTEAHKQGTISDDEYHNAIGYLGSTSAPATQATAAAEKRVAGKTLYYNTPQGRVAYTPEEASTAGLKPEEGTVENEAQVTKDREKNSTYNVINKSLTQYQKHLGASNLTPADREAMMTMTNEAESPDYLSKIIAGAFDDLMGHPITGYSEKLMKGTLSKNQYQDMSKDGRQLVADYYSTMMAHFANMKATQGTIPRNPVIIQTEMHTIPQPFLSAEEAKPAFQNYLDQVGMRNAENVKFPTKEEKNTAAEMPQGATHTGVSSADGKSYYLDAQGKKLGPVPETK